MADEYLDQKQVGRRWGLSVRTLERWRWTDQGPTYIKLGSRVVYRLSDLEAYEAANLKQPGTAAS